MIVSGDVIALLVKINFPESAPIAVGRNLIESMIEAPGAISDLLRCDEKKVFVLAIVVMRSVSVPVLERVINFHRMESICIEPTFTLREVVEKTAPLTPLIATPCTMIVSGEDSALLAKISFPESASIAVGWNLIESMTDPPGATIIAERCDEKRTFVLVADVIFRLAVPGLYIEINVHLMESTFAVSFRLREAVLKTGVLDRTESGFVAPLPLQVTAPVLASDLPTIVEVEVIVTEMCAKIFP